MPTEAEEFQQLLYKHPPNLPATVARVTADGRPTKHLIDWEQFTSNWFKTSVVNLNTRLVEVRSDTDGNAAAIVEETNARTSADEALAEQITTVEAKTDLATASGRIYFAAKAGPAGSVAAYGLYLTAGNAFTGFEMIARSDGTSAIVLNADQFTFNTSSGARNVFNFDSVEGVFRFNVPVQINNGDIGENAVTQADAGTGSMSASATIDVRGNAKVAIFATFNGQPDVARPLGPAGAMTLKRNGTTIRTLTNNYVIVNVNTPYFSTLQTTLIHFDRPGAGTYTYQISDDLPGGVSIFVVEFSK